MGVPGRHHEDRARLRSMLAPTTLRRRPLPRRVVVLSLACALALAAAACDAQDGRELPEPARPTPPGAGLSGSTTTTRPAAVIAPPPGAGAVTDGS